jgi:hypothetical protein
MLEGKFQIRKPDPLMLLAMAVGFSALMSTTATAAEPFFNTPDFDDFMDGDVHVARMGQRGPAVHMSVISPADVRHGEMINASAVRQAAAVPEVYLSIRLPW